MNVAVAAVEVDAANVSSSVQGYARAADRDLLTPAAVSAMRTDLAPLTISQTTCGASSAAASAADR